MNADANRAARIPERSTSDNPLLEIVSAAEVKFMLGCNMLITNKLGWARVRFALFVSAARLVRISARAEGSNES